MAQRKSKSNNQWSAGLENGGSRHKLFFTAGIADESHGLFGFIEAGQELRSRAERKCFAKLLKNPQARRMLSDIEVQNAPPIMSDHEKAIEYAERDCGNGEEVHRGDGLRMVAQKSKPVLGRPGFLGACFIQREMVLSGRSKPSISSSP